MRYRIWYWCPAGCKKPHGLEKVIQSKLPLDGRPLVDAYYGNESHPEIIALLGEILRCPTSQKIVAPVLEQFFLEEAR